MVNQRRVPHGMREHHHLPPPHILSISHPLSYSTVTMRYGMGTLKGVPMEYVYHEEEGGVLAINNDFSFHSLSH